MSERSRRRAVLYHRVSTLDQDPTLAREDLRRAARARGFEVVEEIEETGSGARNDRPGLQQVLDLAHRGAVDVVLVWKLDRFGRSSFDLLANIRLLEDSGVRFVAVTQGIDIKPHGDPMSRLILTVLAGVAEFERELIAERTRLGLERARSRGVRLGRPPALTGIQVRQACRLREQGRSWVDVAREVGTAEATVRRAVKKGVPHSSEEVRDDTQTK